jgi:RNA polymerase sigma-70 factor (ECF subfamily)
VIPFSEVYRLHSADVHRFCVSLTRDAQLAEDLCGDVFMAAMRAYDRRRPSGQELKPWLFRIARNLTIDHARRASVWRRITTQMLPLEQRNESVEAVVSRRDDLRRATLATTRLRRRDRELIGLRTTAGLSFAQVAAVTGMSENSARVATGRALSQLRQLMAVDIGSGQT